MKHGPGWVIFQESSPKHPAVLISILPPRRAIGVVSLQLQQLYVDRYLPIEHNLYFKKHPKTFPLRILRGPHPNPMHVGHNPFLAAIYADNLSLKGDQLELEYKILINPNDSPMNARFEKR